MSKIHFSSENAVQMYARFNQKPILPLNIPIFDENLKPGDIYEISGKSGCGKTILLYEILCKLLLPEDIDKNSNVGVIFVDNDRHFNLWRLGTLLEVKIQEKCKKTSLSSAKIETIVRDCLRRLILINCDDSKDFLHALDHVEMNLMKNRNLASVLMIDSISAFILFDQIDNKSIVDKEKLHKMHQIYVHKLKRLTSELNLIVIVTQFMLSISPENESKNAMNEPSSFPLMDKCWRNVVSHRIQLNNSSNEVENIFAVHRCFPNGKIGELLCKFKINENGLAFY